jgi:hypothetical protein
MDFNKLLTGIVERCKELIINPKDEWKRIVEENNSMNLLFRDFLVPILIVSAMASVLGEILEKFSVGLDSGMIIIVGVREFFGFLISAYICIYVVDELVKLFGGEKNITKASGLVVYSLVPIIIVSIVIGLIPSLYAIGVFGLYSFYLFYLGVPVFYQIPENRFIGFIASSVLAMFAIFLAINYFLFNMLYALS